MVQVHKKQVIFVYVCISIPLKTGFCCDILIVIKLFEVRA